MNLSAWRLVVRLRLLAHRVGDFVRDIGRFSVLILRRYRQDRCSRVAGALAFTSVLGVVPFTAVSFAMFSIFPVFQSLMTSIQGFIAANFLPAAGDVISRNLQQFAANAGRLTIWGLVFLFATAVMLIATIENEFNDIWHVRRQRKLARSA